GECYNRTRSAAKATRPRSSTKGPLDADDAPLTSPLSPQVQQRIMPSSSGMVPVRKYGARPEFPT
ncbi:hypothetical protein QBC46DRAFT_401616, partial [Diplogelasinospora grovesii]